MVSWFFTESIEIIYLYQILHKQICPSVQIKSLMLYQLSYSGPFLKPGIKKKKKMKIILDESYSLLDGPFIKLKPHHHNR